MQMSGVFGNASIWSPTFIFWAIAPKMVCVTMFWIIESFTCIFSDLNSVSVYDPMLRLKKFFSHCKNLITVEYMYVAVVDVFLVWKLYY